MAVMSRFGYFVETNLKLLGEIQNHYDNPDYVAACFDNLYVCNVVCIKYIQEEFNTLHLYMLVGRLVIWDHRHETFLGPCKRIRHFILKKQLIISR